MHMVAYGQQREGHTAALQLYSLKGKQYEVSMHAATDASSAPYALHVCVCVQCTGRQLAGGC